MTVGANDKIVRFLTIHEDQGMLTWSIVQHTMQTTHRFRHDAISLRSSLDTRWHCVINDAYTAVCLSFYSRCQTDESVYE
jgi:hypothetical protein